MNVFITPEAQAQFLALPVPIQGRVREIFARLSAWPKISGAKPLRRELKGHFRIRTGAWRVIVLPEIDKVWVVRIDNRRDVYKD